MTASAQHKRTQGFTLLEVLIALAIFAITSIALLTQSSQSVSQSVYLEEKAYALWIAENTITELRLKPEWPSLGEQQDYRTQFGREWAVKVDVSNTGEASLRRVEVSVSRSGQEASLSYLLSYIGEY
ncbi:MAG: type II secretion system minor pseudopilin GspI [Pseudomonadales bacterium]